MNRILLIILLTSCGQDTVTYIPANNCVVEQLDVGIKIICPDGSNGIVLNGLNGQDCVCNHRRCKRKRKD